MSKLFDKISSETGKSEIMVPRATLDEIVQQDKGVNSIRYSQHGDKFLVTKIIKNFKAKSDREKVKVDRDKG